MIGFHGLNNSYMFEDEQIGTYRPKIEEIISRTPKDHKDDEQQDLDAVSLKGRIVTNLIGHITNDLTIGKKIKIRQNTIVLKCIIFFLFLHHLLF